jgi:hypothetical protein
LAHNLASPCFGREPKVRVATMGLLSKSKNLGIMLPMGCGSMGGKKCIL